MQSNQEETKGEIAQLVSALDSKLQLSNEESKGPKKSKKKKAKPRITQMTEDDIFDLL